MHNLNVKKSILKCILIIYRNTSYIAHLPWVVEMIEKSQATLQNTIYQWASIVTKLTDDLADINPWVQSFQNHFNETCCEYLTDMKDLESSLFCKIEKCLVKVENLCSILQIDMPSVGKKKLHLFQEHHQLKKYISE